MSRNTLKLYPFHTFLVIPFIVLFLYGHNLGQTRPAMTYRTLVVGTLVTAFLFGLVYLLLKNRLKTGVFVTFVLFALFQYGVLYDFFDVLYYRGMWPLRNIHRYLIVLYCLVFGGIFWFFKRTKHDFIRINYFFNFLIIILLVFNLIRINFGQMRGPKALVKITPYPKIEFKDTARKPNIYYIILDGYANSHILEKYYNFKNDTFLNALKGMHFTVNDSAFANYYYTIQSLAATTNMNYLDDLVRTPDRLHNNLLFRTLKENNYGVYHLYSGYAVTSSFLNADSTVYIDGPKEFEKSMLKHTILRLDDIMGLFARQRLHSQFRKMYEFADIKRNPKFCFLHFVAPHPPYVFDRNGNVIRRRQFGDNSWEGQELYIEQLIYVNKQMVKLMTDIIRKDPKATIILQSDHGPWISNNTKENLFEARSKILYAYYTNTELHIPNKTSPVNTFRYLFNGLFNSGLEILPDEPAGTALLADDPIFQKMAH